MDARTAAHVLSRIASYLELQGANAFKVKAYRGAARGILHSAIEDLGPALASGELGTVRGLGPATIAVVRDLVELGESRYLEELRQGTPEGLLEMLRIPALSPPRIHQIHQQLGIATVEELEAAARDGRLATVKGIGPKTAAKVLAGIAFLRQSGALRLHLHAAADGARLLALVRRHPAVVRAELAGALRRCAEIVGAIEIVAACSGDPSAVAADFTGLAGVSSASHEGTRASIQFVDGAHLELTCSTPSTFGAALWMATGDEDHVAAVAERLVAAGAQLDAGVLVTDGGARARIDEEARIYAAAGLPTIAPELREGRDAIDAALAGTLPDLVAFADLRGALHCHTVYSDGKHTVAEMARGARERGWSYLGITDHSEAAFYASGMARERIVAQHEEIDALNAGGDGFRILKGIEADILADGRLDYDADWLARFDFVIGSIHSRFGMDRAAMTARILAAMDDPHLTVLAHPTGRLLLSREPYELDLDAILEKAAAVGVAIELNVDPHRLDLDWRYLQRARRYGCTVSIGPDAHSVGGLDNVVRGIGIARKGWLEAKDVLNTRDADGVLAFARRRRQGR